MNIIYFLGLALIGSINVFWFTYTWYILETKGIVENICQ